jgi:hypothetical protein
MAAKGAIEGPAKQDIPVGESSTDFVVAAANGNVELVKSVLAGPDAEQALEAKNSLGFSELGRHRDAFARTATPLRVQMPSWWLSATATTTLHSSCWKKAWTPMQRSPGGCVRFTLRLSEETKRW